MIIITGAGRTGTSLLASAYRDAGVDPGGSWSPDVRAGLESREVVELNRDILRELGSSLLGIKRAAPRISELPMPTLTGRVGGVLSPSQKRVIREAYTQLPWNRAREFEPPRWSRTPATIRRFGDRMRDIAQRDLLAKDPQFSLTLPVWLAAGCRIDHVIATFRSVDEMIQSRLSARQFGYKNIDDARNALLLANGTLTSTLADHTSLAHVTLRFPDFIYDLNATAQALPLIGDMKRSTLARALTEVVRSAG